MREKKYNNIIEKINNELENGNCETIKDACFKCDINYRQYFSARDYYLKPKNKNNMKQMPKTKKIKKCATKCNNTNISEKINDEQKCVEIKEIVKENFLTK